jgi:hypothetical protein
MRHVARLFLLATLLLPFGLAHAQTDWEELMEDYMQADEADEDLPASLHELLSELTQNPININQSRREDWEQVPFLSPTDIENICAYVDRYAPLKTLGELAMIEGLDYYKQQLLRQFVVIGPEAPAPKQHLGQWLKYARHQLLATAKIPFYERRGDQNGYLGYPYKHNIRYRLQATNHLRAGFVAAQDAGEPFFANKNRLGYDFYSFYLQLKDLGPVATLIAGKYKAGFGMGLVVNNDMVMGKTSLFNAAGRTGSAFRPHASTMSYNHFQGLAATFRLSRHLQLSPFLSYRALDATPVSNSDAVTTLLQTGYHRSATEMAKKNNTRQLAAGTHLGFSSHGLHAGATVVYTSLNRPLSPDTSVIYRHFYPVGRQFVNFSADYGYTTARFSLRGETAFDKSFNLATIHALHVRLSDELTLTALQRFYGKRYNALFAKAFSEGGSVKNESGLCVGATWSPMRSLTVNAYSDIAWFPWPKYQVSRASRAFDNCLNISYKKGNWTLATRYRFRTKQKDNADKTLLAYRKEHRLRLAVEHQANRLSLRTQADLSAAGQQGWSRGWMLSQHVSANITKAVTVSACCGYFHTDDYDSRIYTYERGMLYTFNFPAFYGQGLRYLFLASAKPSSRLVLQARLATINYFDRSTMGSGLQQINHSSATDLDLQVRWSF